MRCQANKKDNTQCDKESVLKEDIYMCTQHYHTFIKNNKTHQYGTCIDDVQDYSYLSVKEYLFSHKISVNDLSN